MDGEPIEPKGYGLEAIELKRKPDFDKALREIYTRLDNARKLGVDIKPHKSNPSKLRQESYADKDKYNFFERRCNTANRICETYRQNKNNSGR